MDPEQSKIFFVLGITVHEENIIGIFSIFYVAWLRYFDILAIYPTLYADGDFLL